MSDWRVSTSPNACMIRLEGGPYDGRQELLDSPYIDAFTIVQWKEGLAHEYIPAGYSSRHFVHSKSYSTAPK